MKERREAAKSLGEFSKCPGNELVQKENGVTGVSEPVKAVEACVETLVKALGDADGQDRRDAAHVLGRLGPKAKGAEAARKKLEKDEDKDVQGVGEALKRIKSEGGGRWPQGTAAEKPGSSLARGVPVVVGPGVEPMFTVAILAAAITAPVPKSLKPPPSVDGMWELVEFNGLNGGLIHEYEKPSYWRIEGEFMSPPSTSVEKLARVKPEKNLLYRDEKDPRMRTMKDSIKENPAMFEVDGDSLKWCYGLNYNTVVTEVKPGPEVYYYEMKRVKR